MSRQQFSAIATSHSHPFQSFVGWGLLAIAGPLLWWVSNPTRHVAVLPANFLFWHNAVEAFAVVVAMLVFVTGYHAVLSMRKGAVVMLGVAFLGVGLFDFLHMLSYEGMPDAITANSPQKSIFFWLCARVLAACGLLLYALLPAISGVDSFRKRSATAIMVAFVFAVGYVGLLWPQKFPALFVTGQGLTPLKITIEWLVISIHITTLFVLWRRRAELMTECVFALGFAAALSAVSEVFFTMLGIVDKDAANVLGHTYKVVAYLYLFHATFNEALRRPLDRMHVQHQREKLILSSAPDAVLWVDEAGTILMANPACKVLTGYSDVELVGENVSIFLPIHLRERHAESMREYFTAPKPRAMGLMDLKLMRKDGAMLPVDISLGYWDDEGTRHAIAYIRDLTERKKFEESLRHQATHDELTGLPNRWLFRLQLNQAITRARRLGLHVGVLFIDLDHFKTINDGFGHFVGDELLKQVGVRLRGVLRGNDTLARLGGDEFAILLSDLTHADEVVSVANKLLNALQEPYLLNHQHVHSGGSLGAAFFPDDAQDSDNLLRYADLAMYQAKQAGRGTYAFYSKELDRRVHEDMQLHSRLKDALAEGKLKLHYQPQVDVNSGKVVGAEALLRWNDPILGQVSPARFIPVAEATGLILPLSEWVLDTACKQIATWVAAGKPLHVAVNISAQHFAQKDLAEKINGVLERTGAQARWLGLEITESVVMTQPEKAREHIEQLVAMGCSVALDDFGTGYSSLAYLKALPVSKLKIDQSFLSGIPDDLNDVAICKAIIAVANGMGLTLVAEGVETHAQLAFLKQQGCEAYQGWLFAKAMEPIELAHLIENTSPPALESV